MAENDPAPPDTTTAPSETTTPPSPTTTAPSTTTSAPATTTTAPSTTTSAPATTTTAPSTTTTAPSTTTSAPATTTTAPSTTTSAPASTTTAPSTTTSAPATTTTAPSTTTSPATTTTAPGTTTSAPAATTTASATGPSTTTTAPGGTTTRPATTTTGPGGTTTKPATTTTAPGGTTTKPATTTTAPGGTTTKPGTTTTAPGGTTTKPATTTTAPGGTTTARPGGTTTAKPATTTTAPGPAAVFDSANTGLRKRGDDKGGAALSVAAGGAVEAYWSVQNADMIQLMRDDKAVGDPDRATDGQCPVPTDGLKAGDYTFKLVPGNAGADGKEVWAKDSGVELKLTIQGDLAVKKFSANPEPDDDDKDHPPQSLQIAKGHKVKLLWETSGAEKVIVTATPDEGDATTMDPVDAGKGGKGSLVVDPKDQAVSYTLVAVKGDAKSDPSTAVGVHFHDKGSTVSPHSDLHGPAAAKLALYGFDEKPADDAADDAKRAELKIGAEDNLYIKWSVTGAKSAKLTGKLLVDKDLSKEKPKKGSAAQADNLYIVKSGLDLPVKDGGGSGLITVDPGPANSSEYTLTVTPADGQGDPATAVATARIANFSVHVKLPDGSMAANKKCELSVAGQDKPITGVTNQSGELRLELPNAAADAVLRVFDDSGKTCIAVLSVTPEAGVKGGSGGDT